MSATQGGSPDSLVGRAPELLRLRSRLAQAAAGRGGVVLVTGEPGIGKSRLAEEVADVARGRGFCVLWGRCRETEGAPAYWPWVQVLRRLPGLDARDPPDDLRPLLDTSPARHEHDERVRLFDAVTSVLLEQASGGPLLLVLDDVHRADPASALLLGFVAPVARDAALLLLCAARDTESRSPGAAPGLPGMDADGVEVIPLRGLSRSETGRLAARRDAGGRRWPVDELHRRTDGNPFFVTELLRLPRHSGAAVPPTVLAAIRLRVARLPRETQRLLGPAAVVGREFRTELLAALVTSSAEDVAARLLPAVDAGLVQSGGPGQAWRFTHVLIRDALYEGLPTASRTALHDLLVRVLAGPGGGLLGGSSDLASHALRTLRDVAERQRAARLAERAARDAAGRLAHEEAVRWWRRALDVEPGGRHDRFRLLLALGESAGVASQVEQARAAYAQAWDLAVAQGWEERLAEVALGLGEVVDSAGTVDAGLVRMLEQSLARLAPGDRRTRIRLTARLAVAVYWSPRLDEARRLAADAVAAARRLGERRELAVALRAQQVALRGPGRLGERVRLGEELVGHAQALGDDRLEVEARRLLLADRLHHDPVAADLDLSALADLAQRTRRPLARWYVMVNRCVRAVLAGPPERALALVDETEALGLRLGVRPAPMYAAAQRFAVLRECGAASRSEAELRRVAGEYPWLATVRCMLAVLLAEAGRRDEAEALLVELTADEAAAVPRDALWVASLALLTLAAARLGRPDEAATLHRLLLPHSGGIAVQGVVVWWGAVDHYLGLAALTTGHHDEAEAALRAGLRLHEAWSARFLVAASLAALAELSVRREGVSVRAAVPEPRDAGLTGREREVLRLLAAGAANKQIARRLGITTSTVERHVANAYVKLGVHSRAQATAVVLRASS